MDRFSRRQFEKLVNVSDSRSENDFCVSIYGPMYRAGREVQQNEIRFKNALTEARNQLVEAGCDDDRIDQLLQPAEELLEQPEYWQHQSDGLAVFIAEDFFEALRLPYDFDESLTVAAHFNVKPLIPVLTDEHQWYIFAASPKRVRLLHASPYGVDDLQPENFPENLRDALNIDEYVSSLQFHTTSREMFSNASHDAIHHGHGGSDPDVKKQDEILQYFHRLSDALDDYLEDDDLPIVFAGVEYLFPIFKETCDRRQHVMDTPITGNPDDSKPEELWEKSKQIMMPSIEKRAAASIESYDQKANTDWAEFDPVSIYRAARMGQVETLIVSPGCSFPVVMDDSGSIQDSSPDDDAETDDLVNLIAVHVLLNGGKIYSSEVETKSGIAAVYRSPAGQFVDQAVSSQ